MMNWEKIKRFEIVLQIILALGLIGSAIGITKEFIVNGITGKIPVWLGIVSVIISFLLGYLFGRNRNSRKFVKGKSDDIRLTFDQLPKDLGWNLGVDNGNGVYPDIKICNDGIFGNYWQIEKKDTFYLDYYFTTHTSRKRNLRYTLQSNKNSTFYVRIKVSSKNKELEKEVWIAIKEGDINPKPFMDGQSEWKYYIMPNVLQNNWKMFQINVPTAIEKTFGKEGWIFTCITGVRLRGTMNIAELIIH